MTLDVARLSFAVFLTILAQLSRVVVRMRPSLRIRVDFAPSRLSAQHLRSAYEFVAPLTRRVVRASDGRVARPDVDQRASPPRRPMRRKVGT